MSSTLEALSHYSKTPYLVSAGEVVELRFRDGARALSLRAAKLFHLLVNHAGVKAAEDIEHRIPISDLNFSHIEIDDLIHCIRELVRTTVELTFFTKDGRKKISIGALLSEVERPFDIEGEGKNAQIIYRISPTLRKVILLSEHWASFSREAILSFESRYALRLFEIISLRANLEYKSYEVFELPDLKRRLGVPEGKLVKWIHFLQTALDPAIKETNRISGFEIYYETRKTGRSISHVVLHWSRKSISERAKIASELASLPLQEEHPSPTPITKQAVPALPKQNQKHKISNRAFPSSGTISYGDSTAHWRELAYEHVKRLPGNHIPDLGRLADNFRSWCDKHGISLNSPTLDKTFIGFCKKYTPTNLHDD